MSIVIKDWKKKSSYAIITLVILSIVVFVSWPIDKRTQYEQLLNSHPFSIAAYQSTDKAGNDKKYDRPDLAMMQEFIRTMDPALLRPTPEVLNEKNTQMALMRDYGVGASGNNDLLATSISQSEWTERGPNNIGGRTRALLFDPNDPTEKKVWAGSVSGGLWFNDDITTPTSPWQKVNDFWDNLAVTCIAADPTDQQVMYVGTGEGWFNIDAVRGAGIWKTSDGGANWSQLASTSSYIYVNDIVVRDESGIGVVYAAVQQNSNGLQRSVNGGTSWTQVLPGGISSQYPTDIEITGDNSGIFVGARTNSGGNASIYFSTNGTSWTKQDFPYDGRTEIATAPSDPNMAYVVFEDNNIVGAIKKTVDGGTTWSTDLALPNDADNGIPANDFTRGQGWYDLILGVHPTNPNRVLIGGINLFTSIDAGASWTQTTKWSNNPNMNSLSVPLVHSDQHQIIFRPGFPNEAVIGNDGGVYYSPNITLTGGALSITSRNVNYNVTQFYAGAIHPSVNNFMLGGTQDNGSLKFTQPGLSNATLASSGDGGMCFIDEVDPSFQIVSYVKNNYYLSTNGGSSFNITILGDDDTGNFINTADYDSRLKVLYTGKTSSALYRVKNITTTRDISDLSVNLGNMASAIRVSPYTTNQTNLFVGTQAGRLFRILNADNTPSISEITDPSFPTANISSIAFGADENQMLITFSNYGVSSVWETRDGGVNWNEKEGNLPNMPIRWATYHHLFFDQVYLATELGVWSTDDISVASPVWNSTNGGLANVRTDMLRIKKSAGNEATIMAATHGRGIFTALVPSELNQDITFNPIADKTFGDASFFLEATSTSGLPIEYTSSDPSVISIAGDVATMHSGGMVTITADQPGNVQYLPAASKQQTVKVLTREISLSGTLDFGEVIVGEEKKISFIIQNVGTSPDNLLVTGITYPPGFSGSAQVNSSNISVLVTFKPTTASVINDEIMVTSNATAGDNMILVTGEGILITSLEDRSDSRVKIYPNPVMDYLTVEAAGLGSIKSFAIISENGVSATVNTLRNDQDSVVINVASFSSGLYAIAIPIENGVVYKKFIKK
ncbi:MAG TPA: T9SS type A sorting domain-containing protein [Cyclobacteriaceae bacterium]